MDATSDVNAAQLWLAGAHKFFVSCFAAAKGEGCHERGMAFWLWRAQIGHAHVRVSDRFLPSAVADADGEASGTGAVGQLAPGLASAALHDRDTVHVCAPKCAPNSAMVVLCTLPCFKVVTLFTFVHQSVHLCFCEGCALHHCSTGCASIRSLSSALICPVPIVCAPSRHRPRGNAEIANFICFPCVLKCHLRTSVGKTLAWTTILGCTMDHQGLQAVNYYSPLRGHAQISRYGLASAACVVVVVVCVCAISPLWAPGFGASLAEPRASLTTLKRFEDMAVAQELPALESVCHL
eukprot:1160362-Pelagomonas_calceolata.AAC.9